MPETNRKVPTWALLALVTPLMGAAISVIWAVPRSQQVKNPGRLGQSAAPTNNQVLLPEGWKSLEFNNKAALILPKDMKPTELLGDSFRYWQAFSNMDIHITIVGDVLVPEAEARLRTLRVYSCDTPDYLKGHPNYHESVIEIDGRKAKLGIDRNQLPDGITARLCFPSVDDNSFDLLVAANCKNDRALEIARQIFSSIRLRAH